MSVKPVPPPKEKKRYLALNGHPLAKWKKDKSLTEQVLLAWKEGKL